MQPRSTIRHALHGKILVTDWLIFTAVAWKEAAENTLKLRCKLCKSHAQSCIPIRNVTIYRRYRCYRSAYGLSLMIACLCRHSVVVKIVFDRWLNGVSPEAT